MPRYIDAADKSNLLYVSETAFEMMQHIPPIKPKWNRPVARWIVNHKNPDGYNHHVCSRCKTEAPFEYKYIDDYDEGLDGEWFYLGQRESGIAESLTKFCPECGANMKGVVNHRLE